jgi:hypothetical protein
MPSFVRDLARGLWLVTFVLEPSLAWSQTAPSARTITYDATEYSFRGPAQTSAGLVTVRLVNRGKEMHWMETYRLGAGKTLTDFLGAITPNHPWPPDTVATATGGPSWILPGQVSNQTSYLQPGLYVLMCRVQGPDGAEHLKKGMVSLLTVNATPARPAAEPRADVTVVITDSTFVVPDSMSRGVRTFQVQNKGSTRQELAVARMTPGRSIEDLTTWQRGGRKGPAPDRAAGGVTPFVAGTKVWFTVVLKPGKYVFSDPLSAGKETSRQMIVR